MIFKNNSIKNKQINKIYLIKLNKNMKMKMIKHKKQ